MPIYRIKFRKTKEVTILVDAGDEASAWTEFQATQQECNYDFTLLESGEADLSEILPAIPGKDWDGQTEKTLEELKSWDDDLHYNRNKVYDMWQKHDVPHSVYKDYNKACNKVKNLILNYMESRPDMAVRICSRTITGQYHPDAYDDNYSLGEAMERQFPQGHDDSESGQMFFYINGKFVPAVLEWLQDRADTFEVLGRDEEDKSINWESSPDFDAVL